MTELSYPWGGSATGDATSAPYTDDKWTDMWRRIFQIDRKVSGILPMRDSLALAYTIGAGKVTVSEGCALVDGKFYENSASVDVALATPATSTRIDVIVLRKDFTAQTVRITKVAGTEGAGVPAITQTDGTTWDMPLYAIQITTGAVITLYLDYRVMVDAAIAGNGVWMFNKSGGTLEKGSVVISDLVSNDRGVTTTTIENDARTFGVALHESANNGLVKVGQKDRQTPVKITGSIARGEWLVTSGTVKLAKSGGFGKPATGAIGIALEASLNGFVMALLDVDLRIMISGGYVYVVNGFNGAGVTVTTCQKLNMSSEISAAVGSGSSKTVSQLSGGQSPIAGYTFGGTPSTYANSVATAEKMLFSTETFALLASANMSLARSYNGSLSGTYSIYTSGGANTANVAQSVTDKMPLSTETSAVQGSAALSGARNWLPTAGISNRALEKGFFMGGSASVVADRCTYSTDITAAVAGANLSAARSSSIGNMQDATNGFSLGGGTTAVNTADKTAWAGDVTSAQASANLSSARYAGGSGCNATSGYSLGGISSGTTGVGTCDKLILATMNNNNVAGGALPTSQGFGASFYSQV